MTLRLGRRSISLRALTLAISSPRWPSDPMGRLPLPGSGPSTTVGRISARRRSGSILSDDRLGWRLGGFPSPRVVGHEARQEGRAEEDSHDAEGSSGDHGGFDAEGGGDHSGFDVAEE